MPGAIYRTFEEFDNAIDSVFSQDTVYPPTYILPLDRAIIAPKMPPKAAGGGGKTINNEAFLAACIKHAKEKVIVDFDSLAKELGITKGGASNKFRAIMKKLEDEGAVWAKPAGADDATVGIAATAKVKSKTASKRKGSPTAASNHAESDDELDGPPPTKKAKAAGNKKGINKSVAKGKKPAAMEAESGQKLIMKHRSHVKEESESGGDLSVDDRRTRAGSIESLFSRANAVVEYLSDVMD